MKQGKEQIYTQMRGNGGLDWDYSNVSRKKSLNNVYILTLAPTRLPTELEIKCETKKEL